MSPARNSGPISLNFKKLPQLGILIHLLDVFKIQHGIGCKALSKKYFEYISQRPLKKCQVKHVHDAGQEQFSGKPSILISLGLAGMGAESVEGVDD